MVTYCKSQLCLSPIKRDRPISWMQGQSFSSLNMLVFANDENTLSRLASHLTVQTQFSHPAGALRLYLFMWLNVWGWLIVAKKTTIMLRESKTSEGQLAFGEVQEEREKKYWQEKGYRNRQKERNFYISIPPLSQRYYETICLHGSDELLIKQPQTFFSFPHILRKVLLLCSSPLCQTNTY